MHTYTTYDLRVKADNEALALADCKEYLGEDYDRVISTLRLVAHDHTMSKSRRYMTIMVGLSMFVGIEGYYPVRAIVREASK